MILLNHPRSIFQWNNTNLSLEPTKFEKVTEFLFLTIHLYISFSLTGRQKTWKLSRSPTEAQKKRSNKSPDQRECCLRFFCWQICLHDFQQECKNLTWMSLNLWQAEPSNAIRYVLLDQPLNKSNVIIKIVEMRSQEKILKTSVNIPGFSLPLTCFPN